MSEANRRENYRLRIRTEQALARGWSLDRICDDLRVDASFVDGVLARMDRLNEATR